ncbi:MAG TPA: CDP-diacylglycerol--glycerol-3-phosphate 3-phosphatidyltransferase [Patescibacteria group bacterium]|jgi:CDP-diacylglycerol--glycerol-3-phosphate 3-phosphatidyltransferase|nr:CDP-diacylglycerol--glycerol-3-phosphate 3-phosphatidyltransferase [Patescibacteria group bacterium]
MRKGAMLNLPNSLTVFRIFLVPILVVILLTKPEGKELWGLAVFLLAAFTDFLDGYIARRRGEVTTLGKLLDPVADKLLVSAALISLVEEGLAPAWMVVIIIGREFAVMGLRSIASSQRITISASFWGKYKMASQVVAISIIIFGDHPWGPSAAIGTKVLILGKVALWVVMILAVLSAVDYFMKFSRVYSARDEA